MFTSALGVDVSAMGICLVEHNLSIDEIGAFFTFSFVFADFPFTEYNVACMFAEGIGLPDIMLAGGADDVFHTAFPFSYILHSVLEHWPLVTGC